jgi:hypothetical protein
MATITIKIDAEFIKQLALSDPSLITTTAEPAPKPALTSLEVFEFLRSKGDTLEAACNNDQELGDFFASFTTPPEKRIESDVEPVDSTSIGASLDPEIDDFNAYNESIEKVREADIIHNNIRAVIRGCAITMKDDVMRYRYLLSQSCDASRSTRLAAEFLVFEFLANRSMRFDLLDDLKEHNLYLFNKYNDYTPHAFFLRFRKHDGI